LVAGPGVFICDECTDVCHQIMGEELLKSAGHPAAATFANEDEILEAQPWSAPLGDPKPPSPSQQRIPNWIR
jgi:ATP-dependent protease Clp ATPase subunit